MKLIAGISESKEATSFISRLPPIPFLGFCWQWYMEAENYCCWVHGHLLEQGY